MFTLLITHCPLYYWFIEDILCLQHLYNLQDHVTQMAPVVKSLQELESQAQLYYLKMHHNVTIG